MVIFPSNTNNTFLLPQNDSVLCGSAENDQKRSSMSQCPGIKTPHGCTFLVLLHKWDGRWTQITDGCFRTQAGARCPVGNIYRKHFLNPYCLLFCTKHSFEISTKPKIYHQATNICFFIVCSNSSFPSLPHLYSKSVFVNRLLTFILNYPKLEFC